MSSILTDHVDVKLILSISLISSSLYTVQAECIFILAQKMRQKPKLISLELKKRYEKETF
jgi:hypothetical protein